MPKVLTAAEFHRFYGIVDRAEDVQHSLMLRLMFYTAVRVSELCRIEVADVDLDTCKIFVNQVQQIVKHYAEEAGVRGTPHTFRHQAITWLTRHSGMADAELQLITGHTRRETLAIYQHVARDGELERKYQGAMREVEL